MGVKATFLMFFIRCFVTNANINKKPVVAFMDGDFILGAVFPIHDRNGSSCGELQFDDGIQPLEALMYTLDNINKNPNILPNVTLGLLAVDSCDSTSYVLDQSLLFIKGFVAHLNMYHETDYSCSNNSTSQFRNAYKSENVIGVIGGQDSTVSIQLAHLLRIFEIPQVSYLSTSPTLSDREQFPYFYRTVPSDVTQSHAIMEILRYFGWSYVTLVYTDSEYSLKAQEKLSLLAPSYKVCFAAQYKVTHNNCNTTVYEHIVQQMLDRQHARAVILYVDKGIASKFFHAFRKVTRNKVLNDPFIFIGGDGWSGRSVSTVGSEAVAEGAIAVTPLTRKVRGFDAYLRRLTPANNQRNPWFSEFWQELFRCKLQDQDSPISPNWTRPCQSGLDLKLVLNGRQATFLHFVRDAAYVFAHALDKLQQDLCDGEPGVCRAMGHIDGSVLKRYIDNVTFQDESARQFRFRDGGDGPPRYTIMNFQKDESDRYVWRDVGSYFLTEEGIPQLEINMTTARFRKYNKTFPESVCNVVCDPTKGMAPIMQHNTTCCPRCRRCGEFDIVRNGHCEECPRGFRPCALRDECMPLVPEFVDYRNPYAVAVMIMCSAGQALTFFVSAVFWKYRETPVIKASGRELCGVLLSGIALSFVVPFILVSKPSPWMCGTLRLLLGLTYSIAFAAIATKTSRIARIFNQRSTGPSRARFTSPSSQLAIAALLASIELVINCGWLIVMPPTTNFIYPMRDKSILVCNGLQNFSYLVTIMYPCMLLLACTYYAVLTRKCPGVFNETKYIGLTVYTIVIEWLAFIPLFFVATSSVVRVVTLSMSLAISGLVQLTCMFLPKVYLVLFRPEKNTREGVMFHQRISNYLNSQNASIQGLSSNKYNVEVARKQSQLEMSNPEGNSSVYLAPGGSGFFEDASTPSPSIDRRATTKGSVTFTLGEPLSPGIIQESVCEIDLPEDFAEKKESPEI